MDRIPIFIITRDRTSVLQESLASYETNIGTPFEIVIHDNGSTYGPMLELLESMEAKGTKVYRSKENSLNAAAESVEDWYKTNDAPYYVVTDPDVALDDTEPDILEYFAYLLEHSDGQVVGPMLRIDDIPDYYPLKKRAEDGHYKQFWHQVPQCFSWRDRLFHILPAMIDTTFGMYRKGFRFRRQNQGIRTYAPYIARHLDWYIDPNNLTDDQAYYMQNASYISHWGGTWMKKYVPK